MNENAEGEVDRKSLPDRPAGDKYHDDGKPVAGRPAISFAELPMLSNPYLWPLVAAAMASGAASSYFSRCVQLLSAGDGGRDASPEGFWSTPNRVVLELETMRLRDFSACTDGIPTLVCAPFALHDATIADFAPGHSVVGAFLAGGIPRVYVTDWRSATPEMQFLSIDSYLAELNVAVEQIGPPVDLVGLCQGGWMALVYSVRFPGKVRRLVLAGAPVDLHAGESKFSRLAADTPLPIFEEIGRLGDGRVLGQHALDLWGDAITRQEPDGVLQVPADIDPTEWAKLARRFHAWNAAPLNLPGAYYLQVVSWLFKENRIAQGRFVALGRTIDLSELRIPICLLGGRDDDVVSSAQLLATASLVGTPTHEIETTIEPCGHLGLFMGAETVGRAWPRIARWLVSTTLGRDLLLARAS
jgi:pimeloyl-ACP methyl ester carboxylesterase